LRNAKFFGLQCVFPQNQQHTWFVMNERLNRTADKEGGYTVSACSRRTSWAARVMA
jgi:hypothetical protein